MIKYTCLDCKIEFALKRKAVNRKYCDDCKIKRWKMQKRDWKRKEVGTYGKKRYCRFCKIVLHDDMKSDRIYCVNCAVIRDKILHHISYVKRKKVELVV